MHRPPAERKDESAGDRGAASRRGGTRTAGAARDLVAALRSDLGALAGRSGEGLRNSGATLKKWWSARPTGSGRFAVRWRRWALATAVVIACFSLVLVGGMLWAARELPLDFQARDAGSTPAILLEASTGEPLGRVGSLKVEQTSLQDFSNHLVGAVLSVEDRRFYNHPGVDPLGIVRAMRRNLAAGEIVEGGSTITQQLVKVRSRDNDRTYGRKLREALTALWLELRMSKDEILTSYLNSVYMGSGTRGIAAAARMYFNKRPSELTLAESAMLAGMIRAPSQYNPMRDLNLARTRAATVLDSMVEAGVIDATEAEEAKARPAVLRLAAETTQAGSWFADWAAREASELTGSVSRGNIRVRTTLHPELQAIAEQAVNKLLAEQGERLGVSQAALVALRPDGAVLAMVGGRDYEKSQFNRAVEANRHPGSAFKLFVYLAALRSGRSIWDTVDAGPIEIKNWRPENFDGRDYGRMTLADAFVNSVNTAAVRLATEVGLKEVIKAARDLGIDAPLSPVPSMALGAVEVSLLDLTGAFASVHAGELREPWGIAAFGPDSEARLRAVGPQIGPPKRLGPVQKPMIDLLRQVVERGTGRGAAFDGFAAGKTGTSQDHRDAWFIGFSENLIVGVWVGNDDNQPTRRVVGGTLPAQIWKRFMTDATKVIGRAPAVAMRPEPAPLPTLQLPPLPPPMSAATPVQPAPAPVREARAEAVSDQCDIRACAATYRSFRISDCTYQPFGGPRRLCEMGSESSTPRQQISRVGNGNGNGGNAQCNVDVCSQIYRSFDPEDCTYQPFDGGPRRICER